MMSARFFGPAAAVAGTLWLLGCAAGSVPQNRFYRLDAAAAPMSNPATASAPLLDGVLVVERFSADSLTGDRPILYSDAHELEVRQHHYYYWVEPPTDMLQEQVTAYLRACNTAATVVTPEARLSPSHVVTGRVTRFERAIGEGADRAVIETDLSLKDVAKNRIVWMDTYHAEVTANGPHVIDVVEAFNRGVREILARFAEDIQHR